MRGSGMSAAEAAISPGFAETIVGGFYTLWSRLPASVAWEAFGEKNGAASYAERCRRIERYRRVPLDPRGQYPIGCIILHKPFFFGEADWLPAPADFLPQTVQGKTYDLRAPTGHELWQQVLVRMRRVSGSAVSEAVRPDIPLDGGNRRCTSGWGRGPSGCSSRMSTVVVAP
jgi:hypothetical protein